MHAADDSEGVSELGAPQTPAGGLRPPALPAQRLALRLDKFYQGPVNAF